MKTTALPAAQGLYHPAHEHENCGVGFLANIDGKASHSIVTRGMNILCKLTHRGAVGADPLDGDGAGLMIQIPDALYRDIFPFALPEAGAYGCGIVFLPKDAAQRQACVDAWDDALARTGLPLLGWREVPTNNSNLGRSALAAEPSVWQIVVGAGADPSRIDLDLYLARKRWEKAVSELPGNELAYACSLSSKTILYKGMFLSDQVGPYYPELADERCQSAIAFVHQRYSTNTFPTWDLAQPFRYVAHNGEINTVRGNINRMKAREALLAHPMLGEDIVDLCPVILNEDGSDTACFDNVLELLVLTGTPLEQAMTIMVPEAWATKAHLKPRVRGYYEYWATMMEPWDGPANLVACDGVKIVASLDRNGLRPARYWITADREIVYGSEAGILDIAPSNIVRKGRLAPGRTIVINTADGSFTENAQVKDVLAEEHDYTSWVREYKITLDDLPAPATPPMRSHEFIRKRQMAFGYTVEELKMILAPMCEDGQEAVGSMGIDTPLAVLSNNSKTLYWYFKQLFAQVTNPPIDPIREEVVMSLTQYLGPARNLLQPGPEHCRMLQLDQPILTNTELEQLRTANIEGFKGITLGMLFNADGKVGSLEAGIHTLQESAAAAVRDGYTVLVLSDRKLGPDRAAIPPLLAVSAVNQYLIEQGLRAQCSLVIESGEPREVHHFALLFGYGATAINPYLAFNSIQDMLDENMLGLQAGNEHADDEEDALSHYTSNYRKAIRKGLFKIFSKMGISTLQSYTGAQRFEAVGLSSDVIEQYFPGTSSRIGGVSLKEIEQESLIRHQRAFAPIIDSNRDLDRGGEYHWRRDGEFHLMNPEVISSLQHAVRANDRKRYQHYSKLVDQQAQNLCTLRGMFAFKERSAIDISEVEPVEAIFKRFVTGAMSLGSISPEAHETLAIAMNRIGAKSNTGEGGEDPRRFVLDNNGDDRKSKIKQIASGRFGVTPHYLVNADELQIKVAQGAKPGEGGQLPGHKVSPYIAWLRHSVPGVMLISPPPHHDIYSIEDLAQLIYDLKNVNPDADVSVKLVSEVGVGTVAAGVAKGHADTIIVSGFDGGTGRVRLARLNTPVCRGNLA